MKNNMAERRRIKTIFIDFSPYIVYTVVRDFFYIILRFQQPRNINIGNINYERLWLI